MTSSNISKTLFLSASSAVLLILAFPRTDWWPLAWIGLIPLLFALDGKSAKQSFGLAYLAGLMFFWGTLYWFIHVTWIGAFFLIAYLALYFGLFGLGYCFLNNRLPVTRYPLPIQMILPALWVCLEYLRGHLFSGFGWASLGHSQYRNLPVIQIADVTGVYGLSFLVVFVNVTLKNILGDIRRGKTRLALTQSMVCLLLSGAVLFYGWYRLKNLPEPDAHPWRVAVIQANIDQDLKSSESEWPDNFDRHVRLTMEAAHQRPDLIIWPETSLPGYMWEDDRFIKEIRAIAKGLSIPILAGAVTEKDGKYFNSSLLILDDGNLGGQYDKNHLVPFGEYVPFRTFFPRRIADWIPVDDFSPGKTFRVFSIGDEGKPFTFSTLICFEDTLARLTRGFSLQGARLLINMTNDGWFGDTKAPFLHLQAAVFRTVENRRMLVRAANTGVSCAIDASGKITDFIEDPRGRKTFVQGWNIFTLTPYTGKTFYMRYGDVFAFACFGLMAFAFIASGRGRQT